MKQFRDYLSLLKREFDQGSDRSCAVVVASMLDERLYSLLRLTLVPNASRHDSLFNGPSAPLNSFSSKIDMAFRIGLFSDKFARDLHIIRKIRNSFAHSFEPQSFDTPNISNRVGELDRSHQIFKRSLRRHGDHSMLVGRIDSGTKGHFLLAAAWMILHITNMLESPSQSFRPATLEEGYTTLEILRVPKQTD